MPKLGLPDFWQGITGALESGEGYADAAKREVREETGIELESLADTGFEHIFPVQPEWCAFYGDEPTVIQERVFYAVVPPDIAPVLSAEHQESRWCTFHEAEPLLTFGATAECLRAAARFLLANSDN